MIDSPIINQPNNNATPETTADPSTSTSSIDDFQKKVLLAMEQEQQSQLPQDQSPSPFPSKQPVQKDDPKFDEIKAQLGTTITQNLNDPKWEQKKQGLTSINEFILSQAASFYNPHDLFLYIKSKLKEFKETNFNLIKEAFIVFTTLASKKLLDKENCMLVINAYYEKISDIKLKDQYISFITTSFDVVIRVDTFIKNIIAKLNKKNNVKVTIEYSQLFSKLVDEYDINNLPIKEMVDLCKTMAANSNPQVRSAATNFLCAIYKWIGNDLKLLIKDIKESTLKIIESELEKVEVVVEQKGKKKISDNNNDNNNNNNNKNDNGEGVINNELLPRVDISKKITPNLLKDIKDGKWQEKKEAIESIEKILYDANYKILPVGLNDLFKLITTKLSDGNKNLVKVCIGLVSKFIRSLGNNFNKFTKQFALALLPNLSDKMPTVREECQNCLDTCVTHLGIENIILFVPPFMKNSNFDSRTESFKFLYRHMDKINKSLGETLFKEMIDPLLLCLQDKASSIRASAEEMIIISTKYIDINLYYNSLKSFKPVIENDLKECLNRIQKEYEYNGMNDNNNSSNVNAVSSNEKEISRTHRTNNNSSSNNNNNRSVERPHSSLDKTKKRPPNSIKVYKKTKPPQLSNEENYTKINTHSNNNNNNARESMTIHDRTPTAFMKGPASNVTINSSIMKQNNPHSHLKKPTSALLRKYNNINNANPRFQVFISNINVKPTKDKRIEFDKKFKFSIETLSNDENKIKDQLKNLFTEEFIKKAFSDEFKNVVETVNSLKCIIDTQKEYSGILLDNLDLILKMISIKYNSNINPSMLKAFFEFLDSLYQLISSINYNLNETEINIILPLLISKLSLNNTSLKEHLIFLLHNYITIIGTNKATIIILTACLNKNVKIKSEVLDITTDLYLNDQIDIGNKAYVKLFTKFLSVNDNIVKTKTVNLFKEIYSKIGDELWLYVDVTQKERDFLEEYLFQEEEYENEEEIESEENERNDSDYEEERDVSYKRNYKSNIHSSNVRTNMNNSVRYEISNKDRENFMSNYCSNSNYNNNNNVNTSVIINSNNFNIQSTNNSATKVKKITVQQQHRSSHNTNVNNNNNKVNVNATNNTVNNNHGINNYQSNSSEAPPPSSTSAVNPTGTLKNKNELINCLKNLLTDDLTEKVNSIIIIHEILCPKYEENKVILISNVDTILNFFIQSMHSLFSISNINDIPIKFAKYLATVLCKIASNKELISYITYSMLLDLIDELLSDLLIDKLDKIGTNQEGSIIFKSLNSTMLRILENCNATNVIIALLELVRQYRVNSAKHKHANLAIKCILKVNQNLDNLINKLEFHRILLHIHLIIIDIEKTSSDLYPTNQMDQLVVRFIKNLVHEMCKNKLNGIIDDYNKGIRNHSVPDKFILEWIQTFLVAMNPTKIVIQKSNNNTNTNTNSVSSGNTIDKGNINKGMMPKGGKGISSYQRSSVNSQGNSDVSGFGTTISELKKKWNDANKKTGGGYDIICDINSMSNLPYGWDLIYTKEGFQKYQDKKKQKSCKVGIIGNANKGKSYILQKLAGDSFPTGFSAKTEGISVKYPKSEELNFILFDTAGTETPLIKTPFYDYDQEMKEYDESIQLKQKENPDMFDLVSEDYLRKEKEYNIVETFSRDKKITEYFLQSFVIQRSDVIILVMNSMTYNEQILLNKIKKLSQKTLFVVHNLFNFVTIEQCEDYIQDTLMKSLTFKIEKLPITTFSNNSQNRNQYFYREKTSTTEGEQSNKNVVHLIMAYDDPNSEAGNYYNDVCIQFLRMQIQTVVNISPFNFQEELKKFFLNRHREFLENVFEEKDVLIEEKKIVLDEDEEGNLQQISLKKCLVDELGEETFHDNSSFEPPYSCYRTDDLKYFVIHLEVPLCKKLEASCKLIGINYVFQITGIIEVKINRKEEESIVWKRDTGRFKLRLVYPLQLMQLESRKISKLEENKGEIFIYYELKEEEKPDEEMEL